MIRLFSFARECVHRGNHLYSSCKLNTDMAPFKMGDTIFNIYVAEDIIMLQQTPTDNAVMYRVDLNELCSATLNTFIKFSIVVDEQDNAHELISMFKNLNV